MSKDKTTATDRHESAAALLARLHEELTAHLEDATEKKGSDDAAKHLGNVNDIVDETERVARYQALPAFISDAALVLLLSTGLYAALFVYLFRFFIWSTPQLLPLSIGISAVFTYFCVRPLVNYLGRNVRGYAFAAATLLLPVVAMSSIGTILDYRMRFAPTNTGEFLLRMLELSSIGGVGIILGLWHRKNRVKKIAKRIWSFLKRARIYITAVLLPLYVIVSAIVFRSEFSTFDLIDRPNFLLIPRLVPDITVLTIIRMIGNYQLGDAFVAVIWICGLAIATISILAALRVVRFFRSADRSFAQFPGLSLSLSLYAFSLLVIAPIDLPMLSWNVPYRSVTVETETDKMGPFMSLFRFTYIDDRRYGYDVDAIDGGLRITRSDEKAMYMSNITSVEDYDATGFVQQFDFSRVQDGYLPPNVECELDESRVMGFPGRPDETDYCTALRIDGMNVFNTTSSVIVLDVQHVHDSFYAVRATPKIGAAEWLYLVDISQ